MTTRRALIAFVATPFAITAVYRLTPVDLPGEELLPFAVVIAVAIALAVARPAYRIVSAAIVLSAAAWFVFLRWLFSSMAPFD